MTSRGAGSSGETVPAESSGAVPSISVIIPARNEAQTIGACLRALRQQSVGASSLEVVVVAAGDDATADTAAREGVDRFGRFDVVTLTAGNKNAALRLGCTRSQGDLVVLLDADTELAPDALAELRAALRDDPQAAAHGAMSPRLVTWVSRYCELNRKLVKDLHFDGHLSGEVIALPRAGLRTEDLSELFADGIGAADDFRLTLALRRRGWRIVYAPRARGTTLFPWTLRGLIVSMLRNRRGVMEALPLSDAALQAGRSAVVLLAAPAAALAATRSLTVAVVCLAPLLLHVGELSWRVDTLRRRGLGDYRGALPQAVALDLVGRGLKLWAFIERLIGRRAPRTFRGERPDHALVARGA